MKIVQKIRVLVLILSILLLGSSFALTINAIPMQYNLELKVSPQSRSLLGVQLKNITIKIYPSGESTPIWTEVHTGVKITDGSFQVLVGSVDPVSNPLRSEYLETEVKYSVTLDGEEAFWVFNPGSVYALKTALAERALAVDWRDVTSKPILSDFGLVASANLATGSVTESKIEDNAVTSAKILDGTIVNSDISNSAAIAFSKLGITKADIVALGIPSQDISTTNATKLQERPILDAAPVSGQTLKWSGQAWVPSNDITVELGSVLTESIADGAITSAKILDNTITSADLADGAVTLEKIDLPDESIPFQKLIITKADVVGLGIPSEDTSTTNATKLQQRPLSTEVPVTGQALKWSGTSWVPSNDITVELGSVLTDSIADGAVTSVKILDNTITSADIADGAVTIEKLTLPDNIIPFQKLIISKEDIVGLGIPSEDTITRNAIKLQERAISEAVPSAGEVLKWNGTEWGPAEDLGGTIYSAGPGLTFVGYKFSLASNGVTTNAILNEAVTAEKIQAGSIVNAHISDSAAIPIAKLSGVASSGANSNITSLTGLTTALSVEQGGTGGTTVAEIKTILGLGDIATRNQRDFVTTANIDARLTGFVPETREINGTPLSGDITLTKSDLGLGDVENTALSTWTGSTGITTLGTITTGAWTGTPIAVANGGTGATTISDARTSLGLGDIATRNQRDFVTSSNLTTYVPNTRQINGTPLSGDITLTKSDLGLGNVENMALSTWAGSTGITTLGTITAGVWEGTAIAVAKGGTGATSAAAARTNLGLEIGTNVQAYDSGLSSLAGVTTAADKMLYTTASDTFATTTLTSAGRALLDDATASDQRGTLGLGTMATQSQANFVTTSNLTTQLLGYVPTTLQINNNALTGDITLTKGDLGLGNVENTALSTWVGSTAITTLGTIGSGVWQGTAIAIANGGTGAASALAARTNLGLEIGTNVQAYDAGLSSIAGVVTAEDKMLYTTASDTFAATTLTSAGRALLDDASASDQRTTLELGTMAIRNQADFVTTANLTAILDDYVPTSLQINGNALTGDITLTKSDFGLADVENTALSTWTGANTIDTLGTITAGVWNGTAIPLAYGGTGATTAADARTNLGLGSLATRSQSDFVTTSNLTTQLAGYVPTSLTINSHPLTSNLLLTKGDVGLQNVEDVALTTWAGTNAITTVGTITTGIWSGSTLLLERGGTGATTQSAARVNLGLEIGVDVQRYSTHLNDLSDGELSGNKIGSGIDAANITAGTLPTARVAGSYTGITGVGTIATGVWNGTAVPIANGGTGATTAGDARTNLGLGTMATQASTDYVTKTEVHTSEVGTEAFPLSVSAADNGKIFTNREATEVTGYRLGAAVEGVSVTFIKSHSTHKIKVFPGNGVIIHHEGLRFTGDGGIAIVIESPNWNDRVAIFKVLGVKLSDNSVVWVGMNLAQNWPGAGGL